MEGLKRQGLSIATISEPTGYDRERVRGLPTYVRREPGPSTLDPHKPYLDDRLKAGVWNVQVLLRELRQRGYERGCTILKDWLKSQRAAGLATALRHSGRCGASRATSTGVTSDTWRAMANNASPGASPSPWAIAAGCTPDQKLGTLLRRHEAAFRNWGPVPEEILYKRMKTVRRPLESPGMKRMKRTGLIEAAGCTIDADQDGKTGIPVQLPDRLNTMNEESPSVKTLCKHERLSVSMHVPLKETDAVLLILALQLFVLRLPAAEQAPQPTLNQLQQQAAQLSDANRLREAVEIYRRALTISPAWGEGWWHLGTLAYDLGDFRMCRDALSKFLSLHPKSGSAWALKGLSEFELGLTRQSLADLRRAESLGITSQNSLKAIVEVHELSLLNSLGEFEGAFKIVQQLCAVHSTEPVVLENTGLTALRIVSLPKNIPLNQRDLVYRTGQAVCNASVDRWNDANAEFARLIEQYPATPQLHYLYGCFLVKDYPDRGLAELIAELAISKGHVPAMTQVALEYLRRGQPSDALPYAQHAVTIESENAQAQFALGRALIDLKQTAGGIRHLRHALTLSPSDRGVLWALASAYASSGDESAARDIRLQMLKLDSEHQ
jgi:tetratricopeptide (TPR) repeat protein